MPYVLGVDVGTTRTAVAVCRTDGAGRAEPDVPLPAVPSALRLTPTGRIAVGEAGEPLVTATGFARRVGDPTPFALGRELCPPEELTALVVRWAVDRVTGHEGIPPEHVVLTHPMSWTGHTRAVMLAALREAGVDRVTLLAEPLAVAENHAFRHGAVGCLAVFGLGGTSSSAAAVRAGAVERWSEDLEPVAGEDFDDLIASHVRAVLGREFEDADYALLRHACEAAKRALSAGPSTVVPVHLPTGVAEVALTRTRFEDLVRPAVEHAVALLARTVRGLPVDVTVLVGGSARIPLIATLVPGRVVVEAAPELAAVRGAALHGRRVLLGDVEPEPRETSVLARDDPSLRFPVGAADQDDDFTAPPPRPPVDIVPLELPVRRTVGRVVRDLASVGRRATGEDR
ncbi:Hsp70 family protein [Saccharothrix violaceirubra]|uniref:Molecular chaperone DnaK (HSP70) n=1 Tax=Saccharothrix violaceirubra TaxID=413306 RepID=A0A7W7WZ59_9PSEU|nr:Hsp70 family protein [Saccharothrix violaceirubra]MBB4968686.1 molecular chaperone DnaK (HSP70) [Saccharothrix violaceirubra]